MVVKIVRLPWCWWASVLAQHVSYRCIESLYGCLILISMTWIQPDKYLQKQFQAPLSRLLHTIDMCGPINLSTLHCQRQGTYPLCPALFRCKQQSARWALQYNEIKIYQDQDAIFWLILSSSLSLPKDKHSLMLSIHDAVGVVDCNTRCSQGTYGPSLSFSTAWQTQLTLCSRHAPHTCSVSFACHRISWCLEDFDFVCVCLEASDISDSTSLIAWNSHAEEQVEELQESLSFLRTLYLQIWSAQTLRAARLEQGSTLQDVFVSASSMTRLIRAIDGLETQTERKQSCWDNWVLLALLALSTMYL